MKLKIRAALVALLMLVGLTFTAAPAQAYYDPWTTHTHCNSTGCYRNCSWWDSLWGCQSVYYIFYNW